MAESMSGSCVGTRAGSPAATSSAICLIVRRIISAALIGIAA